MNDIFYYFISFHSSQLNNMAHFEDLRKAAFNAEKDLNSYQAKQGVGKKSDSSKLILSHESFEGY